MPFTPSPLIYAKRIPGKGLGVFAAVDIPEDAEIERAPVVVLPAKELTSSDNGGVLGGYAFTWDGHRVAIALGFGSLYNHAVHPNAYCQDRAPRTKVFRALRDIRAGEEVTINYHGAPGDDAPLDFALERNSTPP